MPKFNIILNLPGFTIQKVSGYQPMLFDLSYTRLPRWARCNSKAVRKKDSYIRTVHHELIGHRRVQLRFKAYKLFCNDCRRYCNQQFPGINKHLRSTERLQAKSFINIPVVCMDLSTTYRSIVKKHFINARIVADRFHVIRLMQHQCMMTYRELSSQIKNNRGILALLRTRPDNLTAEKKIKRNTFLTENPAIAAIYQFQQHMHEILMKKTLTKRACEKLIPTFLSMIESLKESPFKHLATLGKTFDKWKDEIACMWRFSKSNGITEGFHRKMKLIQRRAYGFRNFEYYRTRVRVLCC